jgi:heptaprenylglyceryl phosphate synthase
VVVEASAVVLATGGFAGSKAALATYAPDCGLAAAAFATTNHPEVVHLVAKAAAFRVPIRFFLKASLAAAKREPVEAASPIFKIYIYIYSGGLQAPTQCLNSFRLSLSFSRLWPP